MRRCKSVARGKRRAAGSHARVGARHLSLDRGFVSAPIFSMSIVTVSPALSQMGGLRAKPTPWGVPVRITVPDGSVVLALRNSMIAGTSKIMSSVFQSWSDVAVEDGADAEALGIQDLVARHEHGAESGAKVSKVLPRHHWPPPPLRLPVARGDVVGAGAAEHEIEASARDAFLQAPADHDGELALVVDGGARELARQLDGIAGVLGRGRVLDEEHGMRRRGAVALGGVALVVENRCRGTRARPARQLPGATTRSVTRKSPQMSPVISRRNR